MSPKETKDEMMVDRAAAEQSSSGHPSKAPLSVESELPEGMKKPEASGEAHMGGVKKSDVSGDGADRHLGNAGMGNAVRQLEYETERGSHAPSVGGHHDAGAQHAGILVKD